MRERVGKRGAGEEPEPQNPTKLQIPTFFLHFPPEMKNRLLTVQSEH